MNTIRASQLLAWSDAAVFDMLVERLSERITIGPAHPDFLAKIEQLSPGFRAMVTTHHLDVSLTHDDFGWHFGNWHSERLAEETGRGLDILEAHELAKLFRQAYAYALDYWSELGRARWSEWYHGSPLEKAIDPLNDRAWEILAAEWNGILGYWVEYARRYPTEVGAVNDA